MRSVFYFLHHEVSVDADLPQVHQGLDLIWRQCKRPVLNVFSTVHYDVHALNGYHLQCGKKHLATFHDVEDIVPMLELQVYSALRAQSVPGELTMHAAAVSYEDHVIIFTGPSSAGKSSLALAAVRQGWSYISDEIVSANCKHVWGIPRSIGFDKQTPVTASWLVAQDLVQRHVVLQTGLLSAMPLYLPTDEQVPLLPPSARNVWIMLIRQGPRNFLVPCPAWKALQGIYAAAFQKPDTNLGWLIQPGRTWELGWSNPDEAFALLRRNVHLSVERGTSTAWG